MSAFAGSILKIEEISMMGMTRTPVELYDGRWLVDCQAL